MKTVHQPGLDYEFWAKKILYFYGLLAIVAIGGQLVGLIVTFYYYSTQLESYISMRMLWPTAFILAIIMVCWLMIRVLKIYNPYILLFTGTLLSVVMILANPGLPGLQMSLLLPMAISLIYLKKFKLTVSFLTNFAALLIIYLISEENTMAMTPYEYFTYLFILVAGYIVYLAVIERGMDMLATLRDAAEKEEELLIQNRVMERLSKTDALTGIFNHKTFQHYLETLVLQADESGLQLQLAVVDIDNFKSINDNYGHSSGDLVLKTVGDVLAQKADKHDVVARYGGEEFAIIFTDKSFEETLGLLEEMRKAVAELKHAEIAGRSVTISAGMQNYYPGLSKSEFFKKADGYLYEAKRNGKNQIQHNRGYNYMM